MILWKFPYNMDRFNNWIILFDFWEKIILLFYFNKFIILVQVMLFESFACTEIIRRLEIN